MKRNRRRSFTEEQAKEMELRHQQHIAEKDAYKELLKKEYANWSKEDLLEALVDKEVYEHFYC